MIRDCYNGYCCIINENMVLLNAISVCAPSSSMYTELSQSHSTQVDHWCFIQKITIWKCRSFSIWVPAMDERVMWAQHGCKVTQGFAVTLCELSWTEKSDLIALLSRKTTSASLLCNSDEATTQNGVCFTTAQQIQLTHNHLAIIVGIKKKMTCLLIFKKMCVFDRVGLSQTRQRL